MKDAIIILSGGINDNGSLPAIPMGRVREGVRRYKNGESKRIIMTGKYSFWLDESGNIPTRSESVAMREYALSLGVPPEDILIENDSKDTIGNALFTVLHILSPHAWKNIIVVTSNFHINRSKYIFDFVLGPEYTIEYASVDSEIPRDQLTLLEEQEINTVQVYRDLLESNITPGDTTAIHDWLLTMHPDYATHPKISYKKLRELLGKND